MADDADCSEVMIQATIAYGLQAHHQRMANRVPRDCPNCEEHPVLVLPSGCHASLCARCWEEEHPGCNQLQLALMAQRIC